MFIVRPCVTVAFVTVALFITAYGSWIVNCDWFEIVVVRGIDVEVVSVVVLAAIVEFNVVFIVVELREVVEVVDVVTFTVVVLSEVVAFVVVVVFTVVVLREVVIAVVFTVDDVTVVKLGIVVFPEPSKR